MPEGPELYLAGRLVNRMCANRVFTGKVVKSAVSLKNPDIPWDEGSYTISAVSRGKEVKLTLTESTDDKKKSKAKSPKLLDIVFRFGMSGKFEFQPVEDYKNEKHAHLNFFSKDDMVLSFVDYRRFGRWEVTSDWGSGRGPCVLQEPQLLRKHVLDSLEANVFNKPICEVLLDQKYFNGIGNYLRAEILYRLSIPPFNEARSVLAPLKETDGVKRETSDILDLCHQVPNEVINLAGDSKALYSPEGSEVMGPFFQWLQCYYKPGMKNMVDHNSRTIWFDGPPGKLVPKESKSRNRKVLSGTKKRKKKNEAAENSEDEEEPKKKKTTNTRGKVKAEVVDARGRKWKISETMPEVQDEAPQLTTRKGRKAPANGVLVRPTKKTTKTAKVTNGVVKETARKKKKNEKTEIAESQFSPKKTRGHLRKQSEKAAKTVKAK